MHRCAALFWANYLSPSVHYAIFSRDAAGVRNVLFCFKSKRWTVEATRAHQCTPRRDRTHNTNTALSLCRCCLSCVVGPKRMPSVRQQARDLAKVKVVFPKGRWIRKRGKRTRGPLEEILTHCVKRLPPQDGCIRILDYLECSSSCAPALAFEQIFCR